MSNRVTKANLEAVVARINRQTGSPIEAYTKGADGKYVCNLGNYHLDWAYGGVSLHRMDNESGGVRDVLGIGHVSKATLYSAMFAFIAGLDARDGVPS